MRGRAGIKLSPEWLYLSPVESTRALDPYYDHMGFKPILPYRDTGGKAPTDPYVTSTTTTHPTLTIRISNASAINQSVGC